MLGTMSTATPPDLRGLWIPLVTPFDADERVDLDAVDRLCRRVLADGARGIVALGTTGEPAVLDQAEQQAVVEVCARACADANALLMVGTGTNSTRGTIEAMRQLCDRPGVTATLVVVPYYTRPSAAAIVEHYRIVAAESPVPVVAYNVPYRTGRGLGAAEILDIAAIENVVGLKQSVGCVDADTLEVLRSAPRDFHVLCGDDAYVVPTILMGGAGAIAAAAHVCTPQFASMVRAALAGEVAQARILAERLLPFVTAGFGEPNPAVWKAALHQMGELATPDLRRPMGRASAEATARILAAIAACVGAG
jgi:4-hydroxy-tetrahydrodipicolinate synthase